MRTGIERNQPLIARLVATDEVKPTSPFEVSPGGIIVTYVKPVDAGRGYLVRLFNAGGSPEVARLTFAGKAKSIYLSNPWEEKGEAVESIRMPANGIVTVRIE
jgi:alpha-mannosidase